MQAVFTGSCPREGSLPLVPAAVPHFGFSNTIANKEAQRGPKAKTKKLASLAWLLSVIFPINQTGVLVMFFGFIQRNEHQQYLISSDHHYTYAQRFDNFADAARKLKDFAAAPRKPDFNSQYWLKPEAQS